MIKKEVITKNGTYKDKTTGEDKQSWLKVGVLMDTRNGGEAIKIDYLPPNWDGWLSLREPRAKDAPQQAPKQAPAPSIDDLDSDPF
jgi:hypothetical protein